MAFRLLQDCNDMDCDMSSTDHAVLMVLCRFANEDGGDCFPSTAEIARCSHFATIPVRKALASLQAAGWIKAEQKPGLKRYFTVDAARIRFAVAAKGEPLQDLAGGIDQNPRIDRYPPIDQNPRIDQEGDPVSINTPTPYQSIPRKEQEENKEETTLHTCTSPDIAETVEDFGLEDVVKGTPVVEKKATRSCPIKKPDGVSDEDWADYKRLRKDKRLPLTAKALALLESEAAKAGKTVSEVITICLENSWASYRASWPDRRNSGFPAPTRAPAFTEPDYSKIDYHKGFNPDGSF